MPAMPTQPTLPFSDPPDPRRRPPRSAQRRSHRPLAPDRIRRAVDAVRDRPKPIRRAGAGRIAGRRRVAAAHASIRAGPRAARGGRRCWASCWSRGSALKIEPPTPAQLIDGRPVCYVLEDYGLSNALILERACREAGLPSPLRPLPGDPLGRKRAYVALSRRNAGSAVSLATNFATGKPPPPTQDPFRFAGAAARGASR